MKPHQIYIRIKPHSYDDTRLYLFDHTNLYGWMAVKLLSNTFEYLTELHTYHQEALTQDTFCSLYSMDPTIGYFYDVQKQNYFGFIGPEGSANYSGITVIDLKSYDLGDIETVKYAFVPILGGLLGLSIEQSNNYNLKFPLSAERYFNLYCSEDSIDYENYDKSVPEIVKEAKVLTYHELKDVLPDLF